MTLKFTGHSGCLIELLENDERAFIRKRTQKLDYVERLLAQALKHQKYTRYALPSGIDVPKIYQIHQEQNAAFIDMAYINGSDFVNLFCFADINAVDRLCQTLQSWIDYCMQQSVFHPFPLDAFGDKFFDVEKRITQNSLVDSSVIKPLLKQIEKQIQLLSPISLLPQGMCHGDLTFSNMLLHNSEYITLIDMLDNFIETPLQDMVKLRQDSCFFWSLLFYQGDFNHLHTKAILRRIDRAIDKNFQQYPFYQEYYKLFQLLNHLRILPYAKDQRIIEHVFHVLRKLLVK